MSHVSFVCNSNSESCIKIHWFLTKLQRKISWLLFYGSWCRYVAQNVVCYGIGTAVSLYDSRFKLPTFLPCFAGAVRLFSLVCACYFNLYVTVWLASMKLLSRRLLTMASCSTNRCSWRRCFGCRWFLVPLTLECFKRDQNVLHILLFLRNNISCCDVHNSNALKKSCSCNRVSNGPGNLLELFFPPGNLGSTGNLQSLVESFWFSLRVCTFFINISYNSCISECISTKYLAVN